MADEIKVTICAPPHRDNHVAEISFESDKSPPEGYDGISHPIGEVIVENDQLKFEIYAVEENEQRVFDCKKLAAALNEGMIRLAEIYPECKV